MPGMIDLCSTLFTTLRNLQIQEKFLSTHIHSVIQDAMNKNDGSLNKNDCLKINRYYGLAVPAVIGEAICSLHGKKINT